MNILCQEVILITYKTHTVGGLFVGTLVSGLFLQYSITHFSTLSLCILLILYIYALSFGSVFPDIDQPQSYLGKRVPFISHQINSKFHHRGFTHSLLFIYIIVFLFLFLSIVLKLFYSPIYISFSIYIFTIEFGFILGCVSHIFFDMFNCSGVCLLYPSNKKYRLPLVPVIKLNSSSEKRLSCYLNSLTSILLVIYLLVIINFYNLGNILFSMVGSF